MNIPLLLIYFRLVLAPVIVISAYYYGESSRIFILTAMYLGLFSDIFDGIIARKQRISTEKLRRMDSQIDMFFWLCIALSTWIIYPQLFKDNYLAIIAIAAMEVLCYAISIIKFKKETCTHAFLSKLWGITLLIAFTSLLGFNHAGIPFYVTIILGLISQIDVITIILLLPKWSHDIPSSYHAYLIRKGKPIKRNKLLNG